MDKKNIYFLPRLASLLFRLLWPLLMQLSIRGGGTGLRRGGRSSVPSPESSRRPDRRSSMANAFSISPFFSSTCERIHLFSSPASAEGFIYSLIHLFLQSFNHSFIHLFIHSSKNSTTTCGRINLFFHSLTNKLITNSFLHS